MKRLVTMFNCIVVLIAFTTGGIISNYENKFGVLTVISPKISEEEKNISDTGSHSGKLNINTATEKELQSLDGIGQRLSERIVLWREENGNFDIIEDIMKVNGIGKNLFNSIKDEICVN